MNLLSKSPLSKSLTKSVLVPLCLVSGFAMAEPVDLAKVYDLAVTNDPQLGAAKATFMATKQAVPQARAGLLPQMGASADTSDIRREIVNSNVTTNFNENSWQVGLTQPVFDLSAWFTFKRAQNIEAQAVAQFAAEQQELIYRVANSYLTILQANDQLSASNAERDAVKRQLEQVQQRFDVGLVAITDVLESTAAFDTSTVNVIEAEGAQDVSFETLLRLTNQSFEEVKGLDEEFPIEYPQPNDEEAWVERALQGNYQLIAAKEGVVAAQRNMRAAKSRHLPTVEAQVGYGEQNSGGASFLGAEVNQRSASLTLNVPIFSGLAVSSAAKQAAYQYETAQKNYDLTQRTVVENTRNLFTAVNTDVARVKARLKGIESSQSALDATQTGYEVGTRNIVDVLLAQQRLYLAQFQYASARYQYIRDTLRLKQTVGSLSPEDIYNLNKFVTMDKVVSRITTKTR